MKKSKLRVVGVNTLGAVGYMLVVTVWALTLAVLLAVLMGQSASTPPPTAEITQANESAFTGVSTAAAYAITAIMLIITLGVFVSLPFFIGKWSSSGLRRLLAFLHIPPARRTLFFAKSIVAVIPLIGFFVVSMQITATMAFAALYVAVVACTVFALLLFVVQLITARALRIPERLVW